MRGLVLLATLALLSACSGPGGGLGGNGPALHVVPVDDSPRPATEESEISVMTYVAGQRLPQGCQMLARLVTETQSTAWMRRAVIEKAAELGATMVIISEPDQRLVQASSSGVAPAAVSSRYHVDALDCR